MFNKEKQTASVDKTFANSATLISAGTTLTGDVHSENDLRIDGTIYGNISSSAKIIVGPTGIVEGNIDGQQADVVGKVNGNITVKELLQLRGQCDVQGNIAAARLQVDPTAQFNGQCQMGNPGQIVKMSNNEIAKAEAQ